MTDLTMTVKQHAIEIAKLTEVTQQHGHTLEEHSRLHIESAKDISQVRDELRESERTIMARLDGMSEKLGGAATKDDLLRLSNHFDEGLNGVLRDAINAVPQHAANEIARSGVATAGRANVWLAVAGLGSLGAAFLMLFEHFK